MSRLDDADRPYWEALAEGRLVLPRCGSCERWQWPAGHRCGACGHVGTRWEERPMTATIFTWTRTWHPFDGTQSLETPFTTILAEIDGCGIRLLGRLDDPEKIDPAIGEPVVGRPGHTLNGEDAIPTILWSRLS